MMLPGHWLPRAALVSRKFMERGGWLACRVSAAVWRFCLDRLFIIRKRNIKYAINEYKRNSRLAADRLSRQRKDNTRQPNPRQ